MGQVQTRLDVEALHDRLRARLAELRPPIVADVMSVFLDVASLPCDELLWSLEFAFDESDGRIARIEARFVERGAPAPLDAPHGGYEVLLYLPRLIPTRAPSADGGPPFARGTATAIAEGSIVSRFVRALADLGAYRTIEALEAVAVETELL